MSGARILRAARSEAGSSLKKISPERRWSRIPGITTTFSGTLVVLETENGCSGCGGRASRIWRAGVTEKRPLSALARAVAAGASTAAPAASIPAMRRITGFRAARSAQRVSDRDVVLAARGDGLAGPHRLEELRVERGQRQRQQVA